jgi:hypothetical protein
VRDVLDRAVRREHSLLIVAAEKRDLDLLALVLVRVVLQGAQASRWRITKRSSLP